MHAAATVSGAPVPTRLLDAMLADARQRRPGARATLIETRAVTWPNGALGCPEPGMFYTEALVPGWLVRIDTAGVILQYHASRQGAWRWCPPGQAEPPAADLRPV